MAGLPKRAFLMLAAAAMTASGCTVVTTEQDKALREQGARTIDPAAFVARRWTRQIQPALDRRAIGPSILAASLGRGIAEAGAAHGRQTGEGSPWTFVVKGTGVVRAVNRNSQRGTIMLELDGTSQIATLQAGPYISGSAVRDALDFIHFDDFSDQIAFAEIGKAMTAKAFDQARPALRSAKPGERIKFLGIAYLRDASDPLVLTPVYVQAAP